MDTKPEQTGIRQNSLARYSSHQLTLKRLGVFCVSHSLEASHLTLSLEALQLSSSVIRSKRYFWKQHKQECRQVPHSRLVSAQKTIHKWNSNVTIPAVIESTCCVFRSSCIIDSNGQINVIAAAGPVFKGHCLKLDPGRKQQEGKEEIPCAGQLVQKLPYNKVLSRPQNQGMFLWTPQRERQMGKHGELKRNSKK